MGEAERKGKKKKIPQEFTLPFLYSIKLHGRIFCISQQSLIAPKFQKELQ